MKSLMTINVDTLLGVILGIVKSSYKEYENFALMQSKFLMVGHIRSYKLDHNLHGGG